MALAQPNIFTEEDYYRLPEDMRAELIGGQFYGMSAPSRTHQRILGYLYRIIGNHIASRNGSCEVYPAPFAVKLFEDDINHRRTGYKRHMRSGQAHRQGLYRCTRLDNRDSRTRQSGA